MSFQSQVLNWYSKNKRDLPWRSTHDPYKIWVSEIILQQTRIQQGIPYYHSFLHSFPNVEKLAKAEERSVLKKWQGLGYYSRARNMHTTAGIVADIYKGVFPVQYESLLKLPGIGDYTASAISSICAGEARPVLDGNVIRVLTRFFGIRQAVDEKKTLIRLKHIANSLLDTKRPGTYNQALMDLGSIQCVPKKPDCYNCPLVSSCVAFEKKLTHLIPRKNKKPRVTHRYFHYFLPVEKDLIYLKKKSEKDIWKGLYDLPCIESDRPLNEHEVRIKLKNELVKGKTLPSLRRIPGPAKHVLSHQIIHALYYRVNMKQLKPKEYTPVKTSGSSLHIYPVSRLLDKFLSSL